MILYQFKTYEPFEKACLTAKVRGQIVEVYTPLHEEELQEKLEVKSSLVSIAAVIGGVSGIAIAVFITCFPNLIWFPINVGGRPLNSWPAFTVVAFELGVLFSALTAVTAFILINKYPRYDREVFSLKEFNDFKDEHYFLLVKKELTDVEASRLYHLPDLP